MLQRRSRLWLTVLVPFLGTVDACVGPSTLLPASPQASSIASLFWGVFAIALAIFVVTEALLIVALIRFRNRPGAEEPAQVQGNIRLETAWTLAPALILVVVFVATATTMGAVTQSAPDPLRLKVIGHQWWWEVQYPVQDITTATDIHVPLGRPVEVELASADVIHSFWTPELGPKMDVIPGRINSTSFTPTSIGTFRGQCAEFCGTQHAHMAYQVIVEPADQFDAWVKRNQSQPAIPREGQAGRGAETFLNGVCKSCHTIDGTAAQGKIGPSLSHFGGRGSIGSLTIENTPQNLSKWISDSQAIKPGNVMPGKLGLTGEQITALVVFLAGLQ